MATSPRGHGRRACSWFRQISITGFIYGGLFRLSNMLMRGQMCVRAHVFKQSPVCVCWSLFTPSCRCMRRGGICGQAAGLKTIQRACLINCSIKTNIDYIFLSSHKVVLRDAYATKHLHEQRGRCRVFYRGHDDECLISVGSPRRYQHTLMALLFCLCATFERANSYCKSRPRHRRGQCGSLHNQW